MSLLIGTLSVVLVGTLFTTLVYKRENKRLEIKINTPKEKVFPNSRDFDIDYKYLKFIMEKECNNIKVLVLRPSHLNKGTMTIISDDVFNDAKDITVKNIVNKLSDEQRSIISFYCGNDVDGFIRSLVEKELLEETMRLNNQAIEKYL